MRVNTDSNTTFNGIYKIPNTAYNAKELENKVKPIYNYVKKKPIITFSGKSPYWALVLIIIQKIIKKENSSYNWLVTNALDYGIDIEKARTNYLTVVSGRDDVLNVINHFDQRVKNNKFKFIVKKIFVNDNKYKNIPTHLLQLAKFLNIYENESKEFNKKFGNKVIYVDNSKELLSYLLKESL